MKKKMFWSLAGLVLAVGLALGAYSITQIPVANRVKQLFEQEYQLGNISPKVQQAIGNGTDLVATAALKQMLTETYIPAKAESVFIGIVEMFKEDNGQALDNRFDKVDLQILWWEGSSEKDGILSAKFIGVPKLTRNGKVSDGACLGEYEVFLEKATPKGKWLLSSWKLSEFANCR